MFIIYKYEHFLQVYPFYYEHTLTYTYVTAVTNGAIKVTFSETTHNRTLANIIAYLINRIFPINTIVHIIY